MTAEQKRLDAGVVYQHEHPFDGQVIEGKFKAACATNKRFARMVRRVCVLHWKHTHGEFLAVPKRLRARLPGMRAATDPKPVRDDLNDPIGKDWMAANWTADDSGASRFGSDYRVARYVLGQSKAMQATFREWLRDIGEGVPAWLVPADNRRRGRPREPKPVIDNRDEAEAALELAAFNYQQNEHAIRLHEMAREAGEDVAVPAHTFKRPILRREREAIAEGARLKAEFDAALIGPPAPVRAVIAESGDLGGEATDDLNRDDFMPDATGELPFEWRCECNTMNSTMNSTAGFAARWMAYLMNTAAGFLSGSMWYSMIPRCTTRVTDGRTS